LPFAHYSKHTAREGERERQRERATGYPYSVCVRIHAYVYVTEKTEKEGERILANNRQEKFLSKQFLRQYFSTAKTTFNFGLVLFFRFFLTCSSHFF